MAGPIRVMHLIPSLERAGAEKQLSIVAPALDRRRFSVSVVCLRGGGPFEEPLRGADIPVRLMGSGRLSPALPARLGKVLAERAPQILHTWLFPAHLHGRLAGGLAGVPVLVIGERCVDLWKTPLHWMIDRALARRTDAVVANAQATLDFLRAKEVAAPVMRVIPNALDPGIPSPSPRSPEWDFLAAGRLHGQKDHPTMLAALAEVKKAHPGVTLAVAGEGPERGRLEALAARLGLSGNVTFLGLRGDVPSLLARARGFVLSSRYEGSSNSLLEALATGTPVVTTAAGDAADLVPEGCGIIVPVKDPLKLAEGIRWILEHPEEARERADRAARIVRERHALKKIVSQHEALYEELLSRKGMRL